MAKFIVGLLALGKALLWSFLTSVFGVLQLILLAGSTYLLQKSEFSKVNILLNGALLFFATALVSALTIDYFFAGDRQYPKSITGALFVLYPSIIIVVSIWMYSLCFGKLEAEVCVNTLQNGTIAVVIMATIYAVIVKTLEFAKQ